MEKKSASPLSKILEQLPKLTKADREILSARLKLLDSGAQVDSRMVYDFLIKMVGQGWPPFQTLSRSKKLFPLIAGGSSAVMEFADRTCGPLGRNKPAVIAKILTVILNHLEYRKKEPTLWIVGTALYQVHDIIQVSFPGYMECGLLKEALLKGDR